MDYYESVMERLRPGALWLRAVHLVKRRLTVVGADKPVIPIRRPSFHDVSVFHQNTLLLCS